ncbi:MAG: hypothetical protein HC904_08490 [Blastochloris sp.]|nr:hypothetical protein [Blastochloris sp.]
MMDIQLPGWLQWLDRRFGGWGVSHVIRILVAMNAGSFVLDLLNPGFAASMLLDPDKVWAGEWWRVFSFLFATASTTSPVFILLLFVG